jgi:hypothetical protein
MYLSKKIKIFPHFIKVPVQKLKRRGFTLFLINKETINLRDLQFKTKKKDYLKTKKKYTQTLIIERFLTFSTHNQAKQNGLV